MEITHLDITLDNHVSSETKQVESSFSWPLTLWLLVVGAICMLVILLWLPFGYRVPGLVEEWSAYADLNHSVHRYLNSSLFLSQPNRLMSALNFIVAFKLFPDSFTGLNLILSFCFVGKGILLYAILRKLIPDHPSIALVSAVLLVVYPADTGLFAFRDAAHHTAVVYYLLALYFLLEAWDRPSIGRLAGMSIALAASMTSIEAGYPLIFLTPILLFWWKKRINRPVIRLTVIWLSWASVIAVGSLILIRIAPASYQTQLMESKETPVEVAAAFVVYMLRAYYRNVVGGWIEAIDLASRNMLYLGLGTAMGFLFTGLAWLHTRSESRESQSLNNIRGLNLIGLAVIGIGFLVFLPVPQRAVDERVFLFSSIGGVLTVVTGFYLISRVVPKSQWVFLALSGAAVTIAVAGALQRHAIMVDFTVIQQRMLGGVAAAVPSAEDDAVVLVFDSTSQTNATQWLFGAPSTSEHFTDAISYLYDDRLQAYLCYPNRGEWGQDGLCNLTSDHVILSVSGDYVTVPYDRIIALEFRYPNNMVLLNAIPDIYLSGGEAETYNPLPLINQNAVPPKHLGTVLPKWPYHERSYTLTSPQSSFRMEFDQPRSETDWDWPRTLGSGWYPPEGSTQWMSDRIAVIETHLIPKNNYQMLFQITNSISPDVLDSLTVTVNGAQIVLSRQNEDMIPVIFQGHIPQSIIARDPTRTQLVFHIDQVISPKDLELSVDARTLGLQFDWLEIQPE